MRGPHDNRAELEANPTGTLRRRYIIGLVVVAVLSVVSFAALEYLVIRGEKSATVINLAGRQRMLSQQIAKAAERHDLDELSAALETFQRTHAGLRHGDAELGLPATTDPGVLRAFDEMQPAYTGLVESALTLARQRFNTPGHAPAQTRVREYESAFLPQMDAIVGLYEARANRLNGSLVVLHLVVVVTILAVLLVQGVWIFEPAARRLRRQWERLRESEERFELAVAGSQDAIWDWTLPDDRVYFSPRWAELFADEQLGRADDGDAWFRLVSSNDLPKLMQALTELRTGKVDQIDLEIEMRTTRNERVVALCRGASARDEHGCVTRLVGSLADITEQREALDRMREMAERDGLTGLANRTSFHDALELAVVRANRAGRHDYAVLSLDFDGFKAVNDALGHFAGDALLVSIAERLQTQLPGGTIIARLGGDEFAVLVRTDGGDEGDGPTTPEQLLRLCDTLNAVFALPHDIGGQSIVSSASIGVVVGEASYTSAEAVLRDADAAMYAAKHAGRGQARLFDASMHQEAIRQLMIERRLREKRFDEDFELRLQPIVDLESGVPGGFEMLLRTTGPELEGIGPDVLIPVAEETGLIVELGSWILRRSASILHKLDADLGHERTLLHVNVSKVQLLHPSFMGLLKEVLAYHPEHKGRLILEVTETSVMDPRTNLVPIMSEIREMGFPLAMDDFGTGHSSLACLHQFPLDEVKIDRSFVMHIEGSREFTAIYHAIVSLADHLGLKVVAEGVETEGQLAQLQAMGCQYAQGYLFDRPLAIDEATAFMQRHYGREPGDRRNRPPRDSSAA